jgi:hypothetical protein
MSFKKYFTDGLTALNHAKQLIKENDWSNRGTHDGILMESKAFPDKSPIPCYRFSCASTKTIDELIECPWNVTEKVLKEDDPSVAKWEIIEKNNENNCRVITMINNMPWPLYPREIVIGQMVVKEPDANWMVSWSVQHEKVPLQPNTYVRAQVHVSVYGFVKDTTTECSKMYRLSMIDPCGLPAWVVDLFAKKQMKPLAKWR